MSDCFFWKADHCNAPAIEVAPRQGAAGASMEAGSIGDPGVKTSIETQCVTFRPRGTEARGPSAPERPASARRDDAAGSSRRER